VTWPLICRRASEVVVVADIGFDPVIVQQELDAQMEHGPDSRAHVVWVGDDVDAALAQVEEYAAEHVALLGERAESLADRIRNAGAVFVGPYSPFRGDYATAAITCYRPAGGRSRRGSRSGGLHEDGHVQRVTKEGLDRSRPRLKRSPNSKTCRSQDHGASMTRPSHLRATMAAVKRSDREKVGLDRATSSASTATWPRRRRRVRAPALARALADVNEYDRGRYHSLRAAIAARHGVGIDQVALGPAAMSSLS